MRIITFIWLVCISIGVLQAQGVKATARVDSTHLVIGDQLGFEVEVNFPAGVEITLPLIGESLGDLEVLTQMEADTLGSENGKRVIQRMMLTAFDSGFYQIPALTVEYNSTGSQQVQQVKTNPITVEVYTVGIDTTQSIRPIKGLEEAPYTFREALPYLVLLAIIIGIGLAIYFYRRHRLRKLGEIPPPPKPKVPPHIIAMKKLSDLEAQKHWQKGEFKLYFSELTGILREYLEGRYEMLALESTTDEILDALKPKQVPEFQFEKLGEMLTLADLVKFAKQKPDDKDCLNNMDYARSFIKATRQEKIVESPEPEAS